MTLWPFVLIALAAFAGGYLTSAGLDRHSCVLCGEPLPRIHPYAQCDTSEVDAVQAEAMESLAAIAMHLAQSQDAYERGFQEGLARCAGQEQQRDAEALAGGHDA